MLRASGGSTDQPNDEAYKDRLISELLELFPNAHVSQLRHDLVKANWDIDAAAIARIATQSAYTNANNFDRISEQQQSVAGAESIGAQRNIADRRQPGASNSNNRLSNTYQQQQRVTSAFRSDGRRTVTSSRNYRQPLNNPISVTSSINATSSSSSSSRSSSISSVDLVGERKVSTAAKSPTSSDGGDSRPKMSVDRPQPPPTAVVLQQREINDIGGQPRPASVNGIATSEQPHVKPDDDDDSDIDLFDDIDNSFNDEFEFTTIGNGNGLDIGNSEKFTSLNIRLQYCRDVPEHAMLQMLKSLLERCQVELIGGTFVQRHHRLQAAYEDVIDEVAATVRMKSVNYSAREAIIELACNFCRHSAYGLQLQPLLEIVDIGQNYTDIRSAHAGVDVTWIGVGNMPNFGTFLYRGDYTPTYNNDGVAGPRQELTSFAIFEHISYKLTVYFAVKDETTYGNYRGYKIEIAYSSIHTITVDCGGGDDNQYMFMRLRHPPMIWEARVRHVDPRYAKRNGPLLDLTSCRDWQRTLEWVGDSSSVTNGCTMQTLASSSVIAIAMPAVELKNSVKREKLVGFASANIDPNHRLFEIVARLGRRTKAQIVFGAVKRLQTESESTNKIELPISLATFRANYAIEALLSRGSAVRDQLSTSNGRIPLFYRRLIWCLQECRPAAEESIEHLLSAIDERKHISLLHAFESIYEQRLGIYRQIADDDNAMTAVDLPANCVMIRKVVVMPLRTLLMQPEVMMTNRVVREFGEEYALRCIFRDDDGRKCMPQNFCRDQSNIVANMIREVLLPGLMLAGRSYQFLSWSNSQIRDQGCYMFAEAPYFDRRTHKSVTADVAYIRNWMGDFTSIKSVPKLMSRMAQCFTQSQPTILVHHTEWRVDDDIIGGRHPQTNDPYVFTDGAGRISMAFAAKIAKILEVTPVPSCFQIRFKGFKGILVTDPKLDEEKKESIVFRKSQQKFSDPFDSTATMEIVKYSMPSSVVLNRPLIMILDQNSVAQGYRVQQRVSRRIHALLEQQLNTMADMLIDERKAAEELNCRLSLNIDFVHLRDNGFMMTTEPFFRSLLLAVHRCNIERDLKRAQISIPSHLARTMYGIPDHTGLLQYGQVFVRYSKNVNQASDDTITLIGKVMVTKNPCLSRGDVRIFDAVYISALSHLCDVIVFPIHGPRPHADEMAGSDLDGDEYSVFFDTEMMFDHNEPALCFPKSVADESDKPPTTSEMVDFFIRYIYQDTIGHMSNAHLMAADRLGIAHPKTEELAINCSIAVDFPKSGQPAKSLKRDDIAVRCPDYMEKEHKVAYRSRRLLGQIYRQTRKVLDILNVGCISIDDNYYDEHLYNSELFVKNPLAKTNACRIRDQYNARIQHLIDDYGIVDEAALVSGHMVTIRQRITEMEKDDYSFYNTDKVVALRFGRIASWLRREFFREFGGEDEFIYTDSNGRNAVRLNAALTLKAQSWYMVSYGLESNGNISRFRSFPWAVWDILAHVKRPKAYQSASSLDAACFGGTVLPGPLYDTLNRAIDEFCQKEPVKFGYYKSTIAIVLPEFDRYTKAYHGLDELLFVVDHWADCEQLYTKTPLRPEHLAALFLQFALGKRHGDDGHDCRRYIRQIDHADQIDSTIELMFTRSMLLLDFIKYIASQSFFTSRHMHLQLSKQPNTITGDDNSTGLYRLRQWSALSTAAFKVYHHVALTAQFSSLHLIEHTRFAWDHGEMDAPIMVELPISMRLTTSAADGGWKSLNDTDFKSMLQKWSGVGRLLIYHRPDAPRRNDNNNESVLITAAGNLESRQRLQRLLLVEKLIDHLRMQTPPNIVLDHYL